ncbi:SemiSWEET family sugar transporter [Spiroplasma alleghenense]|uniref:MtN3 and saliva related transmembrane protein n=1 Tax=Spiroplasma alleghenense TaxID=216931 RepID=A0A345Z4X4_9MOLU|nr:SemiSWEET family transporter [Spiroplasma alleghenense]AXK51653.1 MtN3 and saliva related transmembrane protein [Spiroplasma alleghenense]
MNLAKEIIGWLAFTTSSLMLVPQVLKVIKTKKTESVSLVMFIFAVTNYILWTVYGFLKNSPQIYIANILAFTSSAIILGYIIYNGVKKRKEKQIHKTKEVNNLGN